MSTSDDAQHSPLIDRRLWISAGLVTAGVLLATAASILPSYGLEGPGREPLTKQFDSLVTAFGIRANGNTTYQLGFFALIFLFVAAVASPAVRNLAARLAAVGVAGYTLVGQYTNFQTVKQQFLAYGMGSGMAQEATQPTAEVVLRPGTYCAILAIVLLAAGTCWAGPALPRLPILNRTRRDTTEQQLDDHNIQVRGS